MMLSIIDYSEGMPSMAAMQAAGIKSVARYTGWSDLGQTKILTMNEAQILKAGGISIISNYEWTNDRVNDGAPGATVDVRRALTIHKACGGPDKAPIYFSADENPTLINANAMKAYYQQIASMIGLERVGAYGGYDTIKFLFDNNLITYGWQTLAWSNNQWDSRAQLRQVQNEVAFGGTNVDFDQPMVQNVGQWFPDPWYIYSTCVPFGDCHYDSLLGGSHDMDVGAPPNYPVTALLPGTVVSATIRDWGKQLGILLDSPYNGIPYCSYLHLAAINPALQIGSHVNLGDIIGYVGGGNSQSDYQLLIDGVVVFTTTNPTGQNFTNSSGSSSRIQQGFALMNGPEYGVGSGWENWPTNPCIGHSSSPLNPTAIVDLARSSYNGFVNGGQMFSNDLCIAVWNSYFASIGQVPPPRDTGIFNSWRTLWIRGHFNGCCLGYEYTVTLPNGDPGVAQNYAGGTCVWDLKTSTPFWL